MSIPVYENGTPNYTGMTQFPVGIYEKEKTMPLAYYRRDMLPDTAFEYLMNSRDIPALGYGMNPLIGNPNPNVPGRWSWSQFSNGYGQGNFQGNNNCSPGCGAFGKCTTDKNLPLLTNQTYDKKCFKYDPFDSTVNKFCTDRNQAVGCADDLMFISNKTLKVAQAYAKSIYYK